MKIKKIKQEARNLFKFRLKTFKPKINRKQTNQALTIFIGALILFAPLFSKENKILKMFKKNIKRIKTKPKNRLSVQDEIKKEDNKKQNFDQVFANKNKIKNSMSENREEDIQIIKTQHKETKNKKDSREKIARQTEKKGEIVSMIREKKVNEKQTNEKKADKDHSQKSEKRDATELKVNKKQNEKKANEKQERKSDDKQNTVEKSKKQENVRTEKERFEEIKKQREKSELENENKIEKQMEKRFRKNVLKNLEKKHKKLDIISLEQRAYEIKEIKTKIHKVKEFIDSFSKKYLETEIAIVPNPEEFKKQLRIISALTQLTELRIVMLETDVTDMSNEKYLGEMKKIKGKIAMIATRFGNMNKELKMAEEKVIALKKQKKIDVVKERVKLEKVVVTYKQRVHTVFTKRLQGYGDDLKILVSKTKNIDKAKKLISEYRSIATQFYFFKNNKELEREKFDKRARKLAEKFYRFEKKLKKEMKKIS